MSHVCGGRAGEVVVVVGVVWLPDSKVNHQVTKSSSN